MRARFSVETGIKLGWLNIWPGTLFVLENQNRLLELRLGICAL